MADTDTPLPEVTADDIEWIRNLMGLSGLDEPHQRFLTSLATLDVSACPGSGKTTLVVAKLAILARKWPHSTKGICVLSHTNVAREQIQGRLGATVVGQRLLGYPHFIDTIHAFVNRFLALPWLNSNGYPSPTVDDDATARFRSASLEPRDRGALDAFLRNRHQVRFDDIRIKDRNLTFDIGGKAFPAGPETTSHKAAKRAVEAAARAGYFCYEEMFVWAKALLDDHPDFRSWLCRRFPLVIIDEMQDTDRVQGELLEAVFPRTTGDAVVQRIGDPNQAIFRDAKGDGELGPRDSFPDPSPGRSLGIPHSRRFGPTIAALASPLAVDEVGASGIVAVGPASVSGRPPDDQHALFIFSDDGIARVLDAFGEHVLNTFCDEALRSGVVAAVGAVHRDASDVGPGHKHYPKTVPHYWADYSSTVAKTESHPASLLQYLQAARATAHAEGEWSPAVDHVAAAVIRLAGFLGSPSRIRGRRRSHRVLVDALRSHVGHLSSYRRLVRLVLTHQSHLTEESWPCMQADALSVATWLCDGSVNERKAEEFLAWRKATSCAAPAHTEAHSSAVPNVCHVQAGGRYVDIRLGSIHSVKGQTHLATLMLDTFQKMHQTKALLPWLIGDKSNRSKAKPADLGRLRLAYVVMTRPTHLVCLAARRSTLNELKGFDKNVAALRDRGWRIAEVHADGWSWLK